MAFGSFEKYILMSRVLADAVKHELKKRKTDKHVFAWVRPEYYPDYRHVLLFPPKAIAETGMFFLFPRWGVFMQQIRITLVLCERYRPDKMTALSPWRA